jgi:competence ComEA-like helix-hairpin-helix protein
MKQSIERRTELFSTRLVRFWLFWFALFALTLASIGCLKRSIQTRANDQQSGVSPHTVSNPSSPRINLNTASANELERLPGIGKGLAARIIDHREKYGAFRRPEHLIIVRGISDRRFRGLRDLITVE